jgi:hypothetical protein
MTDSVGVHRGRISLFHAVEFAVQRGLLRHVHGILDSLHVVPSSLPHTLQDSDYAPQYQKHRHQRQGYRNIHHNADNAPTPGQERHNYAVRPRSKRRRPLNAWAGSSRH